MNYLQIIKDIKAAKFSPIYFLMGDEAFFIDKIADSIEKYALSEEEKSFNQTVLYGADTDINTIIGEAKRFPMMAERVVVIVREAQALRNIDALEAYVENPQPSTVLVLAYKGKKADKRKKWVKTLSNAHVLFESKKLYDNQIPDWIEQQLKERGYGVSPKAKLLLAESLGADLGRIESELSKLELVLEKGQEVDDHIVEENIGISKDYNNFELIKAIGARDFYKCMRIQKYFEANPKDNPLVLTLGLLFSFFSKLMMVHQAHHSNKELHVLLGVSPYFLGDYKIGASNYNLKKLARIMSYLRECDMKAKGVNNATTSDADLLKELLFKIIYTE